MNNCVRFAPAYRREDTSAEDQHVRAQGVKNPFVCTVPGRIASEDFNARDLLCQLLERTVLASDCKNPAHLGPRLPLRPDVRHHGCRRS